MVLTERCKVLESCKIRDSCRNEFKYRVLADGNKRIF